MGVFAIPVGQLVLLLDKPSSQSGSSLIAHSEGELLWLPSICWPVSLLPPIKLIVAFYLFIAFQPDAQLVTTPTLLLPRQIAKASRFVVSFQLMFVSCLCFLVSIKKGTFVFIG
jgi:hypothetical protein